MVRLLNPRASPDALPAPLGPPTLRPEWYRAAARRRLRTSPPAPARAVAEGGRRAQSGPDRFPVEAGATAEPGEAEGPAPRGGPSRLCRRGGAGREVAGGGGGAPWGTALRQRARL